MMIHDRSLIESNKVWKNLVTPTLIYDIFHRKRCEFIIDDIEYMSEVAWKPSQLGRVFIFVDGGENGNLAGIIEASGKYHWTRRCNFKRRDPEHFIFGQWYNATTKVPMEVIR